MPIRARLVGVFALVTLALVVAGGALFVHLLGSALLRATDRSLLNAATPLMQTVADPGMPDLPDPSGRAASTGLVTQVVSPSGSMLTTSPGQGDSALLSAATLVRARSHQILQTGRYAGNQLRILAQPVRRPDGVWLVLVGDSLTPRDQALSRVRTGILIAAASVVVFGTAGAWLLSGAALRPVERMRRSVSEISTRDPTGRVTEPRTRDELAALARTFNRLLDRLQTALFQQRRLVADAGHELRGPLAVLRTELELADRPGRSRDELAEAVRLAAAESDRLARLSDDLLFLARSDEGALLISPVDQPLEPLLAAAIAARQRQADTRGITLTLEVDRAVHCPVDADRLRHAVDNLLDNALRFAAGVVEIRAADKYGSVGIEVGDDGPGFPPEFLPHAFERFRRPDDARADTTGGSGLGLAIVLAIAEAHHGSARIANQRPTGAIAHILLPITGI